MALVMAHPVSPARRLARPLPVLGEVVPQAYSTCGCQQPGRHELACVVEAQPHCAQQQGGSCQRQSMALVRCTVLHNMVRLQGGISGADY